jgi:hypothetical protein
MGRQQKADHQRAILFSAFHNVAGLHEHLVVAEILDFELIDIAGFTDFYGAVCHGFLQRQRHLPGRRAAVNEIHSEIFMHERSADTVGVERLRSSTGDERGCQQATSADGSR